MKKIYLLSAVACMFAFNANAELIEGWEAKGPDVTQASPTVKLEKGETGDPWDCQFNPPTWYNVGGDGTVFEIHFDALYDGEGTDGDMQGEISMIQGRQCGGYSDAAFLQTLCEKLGIEVVGAGEGWRIQNLCDQVKVTKVYDAKLLSADEFTTPGNITRNFRWHPYDEMDHYAIQGTLGRHAADSVDLEFELCKPAGTYEIKNFQVFVNGQVFAQYFMQPGEGAQPGVLFSDGGDNTAVSDAAAVKAFFANDVLYASEAADVVVYNVNGVAVKSAKNAKSVNVADLKAGLYIAKVGNATVKFVK